MAIFTSVDHRARRINTTIAGLLTLIDIRDHIAFVLREELHSYSELIDARAVHPPFLVYNELTMLPSMLPPPNRYDFGWRAVVVESTIAFALARTAVMFLGNQVAAGVFRELEPAEQWLARADTPQ